MRFLIIMPFLILISCESTYMGKTQQAPFKYVSPESITVDVVASEPMIEAPVTIDWDQQGRMWVVEMTNYMPNVDGAGEDIPTGKIKILLDHDHDGFMDEAKIFLDSLILPRAIALLYNGLLYVEPPNLWWVATDGDTPGTRILVDSLYAKGGNVEHQPNGLLYNIDNWIYSAKSHFRYQLRNGRWIKEPTSFRGQWGITQDDWGRLYANNNSNGLFADYVLPNTVINHTFYTPQYAIYQNVFEDRSIYPLHATSINRGYKKDALDSLGRVRHLTSACGPLISSGDVYPGDVFICVPEANLIKRTHFAHSDNDSTGVSNYYQDEEFLASMDEGFRPVNLFTGPDNLMYIVDMHRGVIQHKTYMTNYLRKLIMDKKLDQITGMGRILRLSQSKRDIPITDKKLDFDNASDTDLFALLESDHRYVRLRAQHRLIQKDDLTLLPELIRLFYTSQNPITQVHALRTIDGLRIPLDTILLHAPRSDHPMVIVHILDIATRIGTPSITLKLIQQYLPIKNHDVYRQIGRTTGSLLSTKEKGKICGIYNKLLLQFPNDAILAEMIVSGIEGHENSCPTIFTTHRFPKMQLVYAKLKANMHNGQMNNIYRKNQSVGIDTRTNGKLLYDRHCSICHGQGGHGISSLAPSLIGAHIVESGVRPIALTILTGLTGPINVSGQFQTYSSDMPGLKANKNITDQDIADIANFVANGFRSHPQQIKVEEVTSLRQIASEMPEVPTEQVIDSILSRIE